MPWDNDWDKSDDEIKGECCQQNCYMTMHAKNLSCSAGQMRGQEDWYQPWGSNWIKSDDQLRSVCCTGHTAGLGYSM